MLFWVFTFLLLLCPFVPAFGHSKGSVETNQESVIHRRRKISDSSSQEAEHMFTVIFLPAFEKPPHFQGGEKSFC